MKNILLFVGLMAFLLLQMYPVTAQDSFPRNEHRIGIRMLGGTAEFYDKLSGEIFIPNGFNYIQLVQAPNEHFGISELFHPTLHDQQAVEYDLQRIKALGYNSLRIFVDLCRGSFCIGDPDGGLDDIYVDNIVRLLNRAHEYELFIILAANWLPDVGGYTDDGVFEQCGDNFDQGNCLLLSSGGVEAYKEFFVDFVNALKGRDAPMDIILAYELRNEVFFELNEPPFTINTGFVMTANGKSYDLSLEADRLKMADEGIVYWSDQVRQSILDLDPTALICAGFFTPNDPIEFRTGETRLVRFKTLLENSSLDFFDVHFYPRGVPMRVHIENFGIENYTAKPVILGEYGAFIPATSDAYDGATVLDQDSCR